MTLSHTPARTYSLPDHYEDETTGEGYSVYQDLDAEDPRSWIETEHAALWSYREPAMRYTSSGEKPTGNIGIDAFARYYAHYYAEASLELTRRYLAAFHPEKKISVEIATIRGHSQSDWLDVVVAVADGYGTPEDYAEVFRQWAFGDVWTVVPDQGEALSGIYAEDPEEAVKHFLSEFRDDDVIKLTEQQENTCPRHGGRWGEDETCSHCTDEYGNPQQAGFTATVVLSISADSAEEAFDKSQQIVEAIHTSDALPAGVTAYSDVPTQQGDSA